MDIRVPHLAEGVESGTVVNIFVKVGDQVKKDQDLLELETKKAVASIPSPAAGKITKILVKSGDEVSVGQPIVSISETGNGSSVREETETIHPEKEIRTEAKQTVLAPKPSVQKEDLGMGYQYASKSGFPPPASPSIRKMASDLGIDLTRVQGSEHGGRITLEDVKSYIVRLQQATFAEKAAPTEKTAKPAAPSIDFSKWGPVSKKAMSQTRKTIAERMMESKSSIPEVNQFDEADVTDLMAIRKKVSAQYEKKGVHLTLTALVLKALATVLKKHPIFNCSLDESTQEIVFKDYIHFGIAVDTENGLIVPVMRDADKKSVLEISKSLAELAEKAKSRKVSLNDLQGASFTISNQGGIGGGHFTPIINKPEVAILGLGQGSVRAIVKDGKIQQRLMLPLALTYDHRVIDGANAARFITDLRHELENFNQKELKI